jgi:hypothetical protein
MRKRGLACLPLLVLVVVAGCSKPDDGKDVASVNGSATPTASSNLSLTEQGRRHAQCMREHGVPESDPQVRPDGSVRIGGGYEKDSVDGEALATALAACKQYEPDLSGPEGAEKLEVLRQFSRCMRAHGVENYPDPDATGFLDVPLPVREDPEYDQSKTTCDAQARAGNPSSGASSS